ncbi:MAG: four helix bundle protein [Chloroflexi bacterium]|nr:four helix bundle protein [Chloroflexota bacterium]
MAIKSYRDLDVYKRSRQLLLPVYQLAEKLPQDERFDLRDQMRRAAKSVIDNIVEGYSHKDTPIKAKSFWRISMGSANEMVEHLEQTVLLNYASQELVKSMTEEYTVVAKQLYTLIKNWKKL